MDDKTYPLVMRKARELAAALSDDGQAWTAKNYHHRYAHLVRKSDALMISMGCEALFSDATSLEGVRLSFSGVYPNDFYGNAYINHCRESERPATVSVSGGRTAVSIAADLRRRLLPDVEAHLAKARSLAESTHRIHKEKERTVRRMAKAGGADHVQTHGKGYSTDIYECSTAYFTGCPPPTRDKCASSCFRGTRRTISPAASRAQVIGMIRCRRSGNRCRWWPPIGPVKRSPLKSWLWIRNPTLTESESIHLHNP